ncbi:MAG: hypothetical protein MMC33_007547, partial [Icmadophila ericetorum]|nr:hypothetical protein [Icmadophila ericetorum]
MLLSLVQYGKSGTFGVAQNTRTLSLNVLASMGFRRSYKFHRSTEAATPGTTEARSYRQSLAIVLDNALFMMLAPPSMLSMPFVPKLWAVIEQATLEFRNYVMEMLNHEKSLLKDGEPGTGTLMTSLVRASEEEQKQAKDSKDTGSGFNAKGLTVSEILGN